MKKLKLTILAIVGSTSVIASPTILNIESQTITVKDKSVPYYTIKQNDGTWGYWVKSGESADIIVRNNIAESTIIHWHGLILPNSQDGVDLTQMAIAPNSSHEYKFPLLQQGTYWMHDHHGMLSQQGVDAPFIIESPQDKNYQQVVVMFQDFSFKTPHQLMNELNASKHNHGEMAHDMDMPDMSDMGHGDMGMDLNDIDYDAYLTNYHTVESPEVVKVSSARPVKLRFINGASSSNFWINLGKLKGKVVAVDGHDIKPITANKLPLAAGQRADIIVGIPKTGGTFPIIGQVEGLTKQTGLILTTKDNKNLTIPAEAKQKADVVGYQFERQLHEKSSTPLKSLSGKTDDITLTLNGTMQPYRWTINNQAWPNVTPLQVKQGDLVNITFDNQSMMSHPMHLHGYQFKVVKIDGKAVNGAIRDTVMVMPHSKVTVQFAANNPGKWMLHCHLAYHMDTGMMTYLEVTPN